MLLLKWGFSKMVLDPETVRRFLSECTMLR